MPALALIVIVYNKMFQSCFWQQISGMGEVGTNEVEAGTNWVD
jgi:hypothetical protein